MTTSTGIALEPIRNKLDDLAVAVVNRIDREQLQWLKSKHPILSVILKSAAKVGAATLRAILHLVYDKRDGARPPAEYAIVVPALARTYIDALYTLLFVCDDPAVQGRFFVASGWRAATDYHARLLGRYGSDAEHSEWFKGHQAWIDSHEADVNPTPQERADARLLWWPPPSRMRSMMQGQAAKDFMAYVDDWFYRQLSQDAHFTYMGLARNASMVIVDQTPEVRERYRAEVLWTALALHVALLSEVIAEAKLPDEARRIEAVWGDLMQIRAVKDLWAERYQCLLSAIQ